MRAGVRFVLSAALVVALLALGSLPAVAALGSITEYTSGITGAVVNDIASGPDNNLWFTETAANKVGKSTTAGAITEFAGSCAGRITSGPDGNLWFTESVGGGGACPLLTGRVAKMSTSGSLLNTYSTGITGSAIADIVAGSDSNLWFTETAANKIGRITTSGTVTEFDAPCPGHLASGSDGNLWFTESVGGGSLSCPLTTAVVARITTAGVVTPFTSGITASTIGDITAGPGNMLWFTEQAVTAGIASITTTGTVTEHALSGTHVWPGVAQGCDGNLWFTKSDGLTIGRMTPGGSFTEFSGVTTVPGSIVAGSDGNLWFNETDRIARIVCNVPDAPTGVSATAGNASAIVTWTAPVSDGGSAITGYTVTSSPDGRTCTWSSGPLTCTVSGLTNLTPYTFTVVATNAHGDSAASSASSPVIPAPVAPGSPTGVFATPGNAQATVVWSAPASDGGSPILSYTVTASPGPATCVWATGPLTCTVLGLTNGTSYTFTVVATNLIGSSTPSSPSNAVTPRTVPDAPTGVTATAGNAQATVSWSAPASNGGSAITAYTVTSVPDGRTCTWSSGPLTCQVTGLTNGTPYTFTVVATNIAGDSSASLPSVPVIPSNGLPGSPTNVTAVAGNMQATVSWHAPASNGGSQILSYTVTAAPGGATCMWTLTGSLSCTVLGLTNGTTYTFTVVATNINGNSAPSLPSNAVTPATVPDAPTGATATAGNAEATVSWTAPASDGGSAITQYTATAVGDATKTCTATAPMPTCLVSGLTNGTPYTFTVVATNAVGDSLPSLPSAPVIPSASLPGSPTNVTAVAGDAQATVSWHAPASDGGSPILSYTVTSSPGGFTCMWTLTGPLSCTVTGLTNGTTYTFTVTATTLNGTGAASLPSNPVTPSVPTPGTFNSLTPFRILDTRTGTGLSGAFAPQQTRSLTVVGVPSSGVPDAGVDAVLLNVAVTTPSAPGWLTVFPADSSLPTAANLNFTAGQTIASLVLVKVGHGGADEGKVKINNTGGNPLAGSVHVIADVVGYYGDITTPPAGRFTGVTPTRILDTRTRTGLSGAFAPNQTRVLHVGGVSGVPADADAVVMNVAVTGPSSSGWLTISPAGQGTPTASSLNFGPAETIANLVTVKLGTNGGVAINNSGTCVCAGTVHVVGDVTGYYRSGVVGSVLTPIAPQRILDTRNGTGGVTGAVGPGATITVDPKTASGLPPVGAYLAVAVRVAAVTPTAYGWLTAFPSGVSEPTAANLNFAAGETIGNLVKIAVGVDGKLKISNTTGNPAAGSVHVVIDIVGYYT